MSAHQGRELGLIRARVLHVQLHLLHRVGHLECGILHACRRKAVSRRSCMASIVRCQTLGSQLQSPFMHYLQGTKNAQKCFARCDMEPCHRYVVHGE